MKRVAVVGADEIGASWTAWFLSQGLDVDVWDPNPDFESYVGNYVARAWPALERLGLRPGAAPDRWSPHQDRLEAVSRAQFVQESLTETPEIAREFYAAVEPAMLPEAILASSAGMMRMTDLQGGLSTPGRFVIGHPFNPPHLIPLVEVVPGDRTTAETVDFCMAFYRAIGKHPIHVRKEVPGHLGNRLQAALYREAVNLVAEGVASVEDVDRAITHGPGLRWSIIGPHLAYHLAGGMSFMRVNESWWPTLGQPQLTPELCERLLAGVRAETDGQDMASLTGQRNDLLVTLLQTIGSRRPGERQT
ncbi:3-hydroxyacyl-CoA dehydrogenase NAD-binding domain-containing protein [Devosia sp.]|uniref:3-hydroxyacyl-CoA dehydrogenase NAD-binding domain-containing protein n=1 Tax=Devosia sp. TaxID=1871048 RepID=UPI002EDC2A5F